MRFETPHPIPYQGSKRRLAPAILSHIPKTGYTRLIEPFAGSAALTLAAATRNVFSNYLIADILQPLVGIWQQVIDDPATLAREYGLLWQREREQPIHAYYLIRAEFNSDRNPAKLLYLLARCVKNAVRFNPTGDFNQSADKRRTGTRPEIMEREISTAHRVLAGKTIARCADYMDLFDQATAGDFFYLDPPYQGTSEGRDTRYIKGVGRAELIGALDLLNRKRIPFILSYDGFCGGHEYGEPLPEDVAHRILLDVGRSSQATLNGRADNTVESLYVSPVLANNVRFSRMLRLEEFAQQARLFQLR